jgi:hypothetical protein
MDSTAAREETYMAWMVNLCIPGYVFMHSALTAIAKAVEAISNLPEITCAIILCPNTGTSGDNYSDASIMNAAHDVEDLLKDPDLGIMYLPVTMTFMRHLSPFNLKGLGSIQRSWCCHRPRNLIVSRNRSHFCPQ